MDKQPDSQTSKTGAIVFKNAIATAYRSPFPGFDKADLLPALN